MSVITKEYISNMSYLPKVLLQLVATEDGYWACGGLVGLMGGFNNKKMGFSIKLAGWVLDYTVFH